MSGVGGAGEGKTELSFSNVDLPLLLSIDDDGRNGCAMA
jgi:hypothetical protein